MVYTAEALPLVAGPLVAFYWPWPRWCRAAWDGACIWKMKAKHHKKLPGRLHRPRNRRAVDLASDNGQPQTLERESYTGPSNGKYEPWYKTPARVTFNLSICLVFDCILWVWVSVLGFDAARDPPESWLPSVIRDQDGIKQNNKHDPFRNNLRLFFPLISGPRSLVIANPVRC